MGFDLLNEQVELTDTLCSLHHRQGYTFMLMIQLCSVRSPVVDKWMSCIAEGMEKLGFIVPERVTNEELSKVIGYAWNSEKRVFSLPLKKRMLLYSALIELSSHRLINVDLMRAVVGVWSFGAQLRRDVCSVPFVLYNFIDRFQGQVVRLWPSVRCELIQMAWAVRFMELKVDLPFSDELLATDAMGGNDFDHGGFGVCTAPLSSQELDCLRVSAEQTGFALNLSDEGLSNPERVIVPTIPFTVLPDMECCHAWTLEVF